METMHGYQYDKSSGHVSPNGTWFKAESGGEEFFLKKFQNPKYPKEGINPDLYNKKKKECDEWLSAKRELIKALNELGDGRGNIISPRDVFREKLCFYQATYWINVQTDSLDKVKAYSTDNKIMLLRTYAAALKRVHSKEIIHGDLKPENILIAKSGIGKPVAKLIDFDDSYFSKRALPPELTVVTDAYQSPELAAYKLGNEEYREKLTCASDVFASGIIIHQFWTGEMPDYPGKKDGKFVFQAIAAGEKCTLDKKMPKWLQDLITDMLSLHPEDRPTMDEVHVAVSDQKYTSKAATPPPPPPVDYSKLDQVLSRVPKDLSVYTKDSAKQVKLICIKIKEIRVTADQATVNEWTKRLLVALKGLKKEAAPTPPPVETKGADFTKIDQILAKVPANLSKYTIESVVKLNKVRDAIKAKRSSADQAEVDKLTKYLFAAVKGLTPKSGDTRATGGDVPPAPPAGSFNIKPADRLPNGYSRVEIISDSKVRVYTATGSKMVLSAVAAKGMGLIEPV